MGSKAVLPLLFSLIPLSSCGFTDGRSTEQKTWDEASNSERQQWCQTLDLAEAQGKSLIFILEDSGLTLAESTLWVMFLEQKCP